MTTSAEKLAAAARDMNATFIRKDHNKARTSGKWLINDAETDTLRSATPAEAKALNAIWPYPGCSPVFSA